MLINSKSILFVGVFAWLNFNPVVAQENNLESTMRLENSNVGNSYPVKSNSETALSPPTQKLKDIEPYSQGTSLYIHSLDGLNLRAAPSLAAKKVTRMIYGEHAVVESRTNNLTTITYDNIDGLWVHISYKGVTGYAFGGYLSRFPVPKSKSLKEYVNSLKLAGKNLAEFDVETKFDNPNSNSKFAIVLTNARFIDGFLVAKKLFSIPNRFRYPIKSRLKVTTINDPEIRAEISGKSIEIHRNDNGDITGLIYFEKGQGWGRKSTITVIEDNSIRLQVDNFSG